MLIILAISSYSHTLVIIGLTAHQTRYSMHFDGKESFSTRRLLGLTALAVSSMSHNAAPQEKMLHRSVLVTNSGWINGEFWGDTVFIRSYWNMLTTLCASGLVLHARLHLFTFNAVKQFVLFSFHISKSKYDAKQKFFKNPEICASWSKGLNVLSAEPQGKASTPQETPWERVCI